MKSNKSLLIIAASSLTFAACSADTSSTQATTQTPATQTTSSNAASPAANAGIMRAHSGTASGESATPQDAQTTTARPMMGTPIDTSAFDAEIARLEKDVKANPKEASKTTLAAAYLKRAQALTAAQQYRSALGDFRRTLTYEPNNKDAKEMETQIIAIFQSLNREAPAPGTEPAPLPFKKQ
ncbi:MAG: hypothetical protein MSG64_07840 [Pyrinomonadaceae bacterium MAG19_C2-C3]|nr:hypothetical protein [Pyrinomonadaceae bacterium MAG19_C2-C3]